MNRLPIHVFTLALDSMPWLACVFAELNRLRGIEWTWVIVEGAAMNVADTRWCAKQLPRLSNDGTTEFLDDIANHPRVRVERKTQWHGKVAMCNAALKHFTTPGVLLQVDSDELWTADQLRRIVEMFEDDASLGRAAFDCRYFFGPSIIALDSVDWHRAWRYEAGDTFRTHEPPVMARERGRFVDRQYTKALGMEFDHYSWCLRKHVAQKAKFYGPRYRMAVEGWEQLQSHKEFPTMVKQFLPWTSPTTIVDQLQP